MNYKLKYYIPVHRVPHDTNQRVDGVIHRHYIRDFVSDNWNGPQESSHNTGDYARRAVYVFQPTGIRFRFCTANWKKNEYVRIIYRCFGWAINYNT